MHSAESSIDEERQRDRTQEGPVQRKRTLPSVKCDEGGPFCSSVFLPQYAKVLKIVRLNNVIQSIHF